MLAVAGNEPRYERCARNSRRSLYGRVAEQRLTFPDRRAVEHDLPFSVRGLPGPSRGADADEAARRSRNERRKRVATMRRIPQKR